MRFLELGLRKWIRHKCFLFWQKKPKNKGKFHREILAFNWNLPKNISVTRGKTLHISLTNIFPIEILLDTISVFFFFWFIDVCIDVQFINANVNSDNYHLLLLIKKKKILYPLPWYAFIKKILTVFNRNILWLSKEKIFWWLIIILLL